MRGHGGIQFLFVLASRARRGLCKILSWLAKRARGWGFRSHYLHVMLGACFAAPHRWATSE